MDVTHWRLQPGWCSDCGRWTKAPVPADDAIRCAPRFTALIDDLARTYVNRRRMVQTFLASVWQVPLSLVALQKLLDRVTLAFFFFNVTATTEIYTLSLHDALPI